MTARFGAAKENMREEWQRLNESDALQVRGSKGERDTLRRIGARGLLESVQGYRDEGKRPLHKKEKLENWCMSRRSLN